MIYSSALSVVGAGEERRGEEDPNIYSGENSPPPTSASSSTQSSLLTFNMKRIV